jgi:hypothetical protein
VVSPSNASPSDVSASDAAPTAVAAVSPVHPQPDAAVLGPAAVVDAADVESAPSAVAECSEGIPSSLVLVGCTPTVMYKSTKFGVQVEAAASARSPKYFL